MAIIANNNVIGTGFIAIYSGSNVAVGEAFQCASSIITSLVFRLKRVGSPTGNFVAKIYSSTGTYGTDAKPLALLATSDTQTAASLSTTAADITITFSGAQQITLSAATTYIAVLEYASGDASNYVAVMYTANSYAGNYSFYSGIWTSDSAVDMYFIANGTAPVATSQASFLLNMI